MKNTQKRSNDEAEINITPMLDVVFIMLIFFIVTTTFVKEKTLPIHQASLLSTHNEKVAVAAITLQTDSIAVNNKETSIEALASVLAHLKSENPELKARVLADADTTTGDLVRVLDQIHLAEISDYAISSL